MSRPNRDVPRRKIFCRFLLSFLLWTQLFLVADVAQCGVAENVWVIGALGMPLVFAPSTSFAAGVPFRVGACSNPSFATIWSVPTRMWADLQTTSPPREPLVSSAAYALAITRSLRAISAGACRPTSCLTPIDTASCLHPEARGLAETWRHSLLRDPKEAELRAELGLVRLFSQIPR